MADTEKKVRALGLCSGGLDSILSGLVLREQGITVAWISFETPFFSSQKARRAAEMTGIPLTVHNITEPFLRMLRDPPCGYGQNMNPCLDCHALMFRLAGVRMEEWGFNFLFSGEVLGQRPMSQTRKSLRYVEKRSGYADRIVRPLSVRMLPETLPERMGWIKREALFDFTGRGRKPQIELARRLGVSEYPNPAGGCMLTDRQFSRRLKDLFDRETHLSENALHLLRHGRHFRLGPHVKTIIGRDERDNDAICAWYRPDADILIDSPYFPAPVALITGSDGPDHVRTAAGLCLGYSKALELGPIDVVVKTPAGESRMSAQAIRPETMRHCMV